jgi:hypothetical protein
VRWIGRIKALFAPPPRPRAPQRPRRRPPRAGGAGCVSSALPGVARPSAAWTSVSEWGRVASQGFPWADGLGKGNCGLRGGIPNGIAKAQRRETPLHGAHVAYEPTRHVVGFVDPRALCLATTGRCMGGGMAARLR